MDILKELDNKIANLPQDVKDALLEFAKVLHRLDKGLLSIDTSIAEMLCKARTPESLPAQLQSADARYRKLIGYAKDYQAQFATSDKVNVFNTAHIPAQ